VPQNAAGLLADEAPIHELEELQGLITEGQEPVSWPSRRSPPASRRSRVTKEQVIEAAGHLVDPGHRHRRRQGKARAVLTRRARAEAAAGARAQPDHARTSRRSPPSNLTVEPSLAFAAPVPAFHRQGPAADGAPRRSRWPRRMRTPRRHGSHGGWSRANSDWSAHRQGYLGRGLAFLDLVLRTGSAGLGIPAPRSKLDLPPRATDRERTPPVDPPGPERRSNRRQGRRSEFPVHMVERPLNKVIHVEPPAPAIGWRAASPRRGGRAGHGAALQEVRDIMRNVAAARLAPRKPVASRDAGSRARADFGRERHSKSPFERSRPRPLAPPNNVRRPGRAARPQRRSRVALMASTGGRPRTLEEVGFCRVST